MRHVLHVGAAGTLRARIIVTGSSGLLGRRLCSVLRGHDDVTGISRHAQADRSSISVDITEKERLTKSILEIAPHVIVHAAAETDVDGCESDREVAWNVNVKGTSNIAESCAKIGAKLVLISTDYVFDGAKGNYNEADEPNPVNYYGVTKLQAERVAASISSESLIIRTSVLYGWHPRRMNFATWMLNELRQGRKVRVAEDHVNSPTYVDNLAEVIQIAIERNTEGILHVAGSERITRFGFALRIAKTFGLDQALIVPVKLHDLHLIAKRPRDSSLNVAKAEEELNVELFGVHHGLYEMMKTA